MEMSWHSWVDAETPNLTNPSRGEEPNLSLWRTKCYENLLLSRQDTDSLQFSFRAALVVFRPISRGVEAEGGTGYRRYAMLSAINPFIA